jgi:hypothetical protein
MILLDMSTIIFMLKPYNCRIVFVVEPGVIVLELCILTRVAH